MTVHATLLVLYRPCLSLPHILKVHASNYLGIIFIPVFLGWFWFYGF